MAYDASIPNDSEELWQKLGPYAAAAYVDDEEKRSHIETYFQRLLARKSSGEDLRLDFVEAKHQVTGQTYRAFRLNKAMIMSIDPAVLLSPYPRCNWVGDISGVSTNLNIGILFRDLRDNSETRPAVEEEILSELHPFAQCQYALPSFKHDYANSLAEQIKEALSFSIEGGTSKEILGEGVLRYARYTPTPYQPHTDTRRDLASPIEEWNYVIAHPLLRTGTVFSLPASVRGGEKIRVSCPTHATSSHLALRLNPGNYPAAVLGAEHFAQGHPLGRGIVIFPESGKGRTWYPLRNDPSPWKMTPCAFGD